VFLLTGSITGTVWPVSNKVSFSLLKFRLETINRSGGRTGFPRLRKCRATIDMPTKS